MLTSRLPSVESDTFMIERRLFRQISMALLAILGGSVFHVAHAELSPRSTDVRMEDFLGAGYRALSRGNPAEARALFRAYLARRPDSAKGLAGAGLADVRLGHYSEGMSALERARALGENTATVQLGLASAHLGMREYEKALAHLDATTPSVSSSSSAQQLRGLSLYHLGRDREAREAFGRVVRSSKELAGRARLYLAALDLKTGSFPAARSELEELSRERSGSSVGLTAGRMLRALERPAQKQCREDKSWRHRADLAAGYDSNVIGLGDQQVLPAQISREDAAFTSLAVSGETDRVVDPDDRWWASYGVGARFNGDLSPFDTAFLSLSGGWRRSLAHRRALSVGGGFSQDFLDGRWFSKAEHITPAFTFYGNDEVSTSVYYSRMARDYTGTVFPQFFSRDGVTNEVGLTLSYRPAQSPWRFSARCGNGRINSDGSDFDTNFDLFVVGAGRSVGSRAEASAYVGYENDEYTNANSRSATGARREDDILTAGLGLVYSCRRSTNWKLFGDFQHRRNRDGRGSTVLLNVRRNRS